MPSSRRERSFNQGMSSVMELNISIRYCRQLAVNDRPLPAQTVKELPNERFRREEKCEREPSGFPFTFHHPAAAGKIAK